MSFIRLIEPTLVMPRMMICEPTTATRDITSRFRSVVGTSQDHFDLAMANPARINPIRDTQISRNCRSISKPIKVNSNCGTILRIFPKEKNNTTTRETTTALLRPLFIIRLSSPHRISAAPLATTAGSSTTLRGNCWILLV